MGNQIETAACASSTARPELSECSREPIHIPGSIQPHGVLLVVDQADFRVVQASTNTHQWLEQAVEQVLGSSLAAVIGTDGAACVAEYRERNAKLHRAQDLGVVAYQCGRHLRAMVHLAAPSGLLGQADLSQADLRPAALGRADDKKYIVLELESQDESGPRFQNLLPSFATFFGQEFKSFQDLLTGFADEVRRVTGLGRVLVYQFSSTWDGQVVAESREHAYDSYLGQWFPASDIPEQARKLYAVNRIRLIANSEYEPVPIVGLRVSSEETGSRPLDMTFSTLRSVSPIHLEYLRNMGVGSSMSVSILDGSGKLWGLIACHHVEPKHVGSEVRNVCDLLGQALSTRLQIFEQRSEYEHRLRLKSIIAELLRFMAEADDFMAGLISHPQELLAFADADGCAVVSSEQCTLIGSAPPEPEVLRLVTWLTDSGRADIFHTDSVRSVIPQSEELAKYASGVLAISISKVHRSCILWFRPEFVKTIDWSGNPHKGMEKDGRIHPRKSFEVWRETIRGQSRPWQTAVVETASELRSSVVGIVLRKAEELSELAEELRRSNRELEAFSYSVSHDLRAPFRHIVGFAELLKESRTAQLSAQDQRYVDTIIRSARFAGTLVDNLLSFSRTGRAKLHFRQVDMNQIVAEVRRDLESESAGRNIRWEIGPLPTVYADLVMLRLVMQNLLQNAVKYTRNRTEAVISVTSTLEGRQTIFCIRDNGVGFDQTYGDKLFGVFQRLHRAEEFEGTGIGLANVQRIISRHGGKTWAHGEVGTGATFYFSLPASMPNSGGN